MKFLSGKRDFLAMKNENFHVLARHVDYSIIRYFGAAKAWSFEENV